METKNKIIPGDIPGTLKVKLTQGKFAIIDEEDIEKISEYRWYAAKHRRTWYAIAADTKANGSKCTARMHRIILPGSELVDHSDGNGLNNRKSNLRQASSLENARNRPMRSDNSIGYKGVHLEKRRSTRRFRAQITVDKHTKHIGYFNTAEEAFEAYCEAANKFFGEFARTT